MEAQVTQSLRGFGEIDNDRGSDNSISGISEDSVSESAVSDEEDDDGGSVHSSSSDARHDLDYLLHVEGKLLSELLVAS